MPVYIWDIVQDNLSSVATADTNTNAFNYHFDTHSFPIPQKPDSAGEDIVVYTPDETAFPHTSSGIHEVSRDYMQDFKSGNTDGSAGRLADSEAWSEEYMDGWIYTDHTASHADVGVASPSVTISAMLANSCSSRIDACRDVHTWIFFPASKAVLSSPLPWISAETSSRVNCSLFSSDKAERFQYAFGNKVTASMQAEPVLPENLPRGPRPQLSGACLFTEQTMLLLFHAGKLEAAAAARAAVAATRISGALQTN